MVAAKEQRMISIAAKEKLFLTTREQLLFTFSFCFLLCFRSLNYFINELVQNGLRINLPISPFLYGIAAFLGVLSYIYIFKKASIISIFLFLFLVLGTLVFLLAHKDNTSLIFTSIFDLAYSPVHILFLYCLPTMNYLLLIKNFKKILRILFFYSFLVLLLSIICYFGFSIGVGYTDSSYMTISYNMLPFACIASFYSSNKKVNSFLTKLIVILSFFIIFISGARGAMICSLFFFALLLLFKKMKPLIKCLLVTVVLLIFILIVSGFAKEILAFFLNNSNTYSRTIMKMLDGSFFVSSGRNEIYSTLWQGVLASPFFGYGLWGERVLINGFSHNIILEILSSFGLFFGILIIAYFALLVTMTFLHQKSILLEIRILLLSFLPYGLVSLLFSGSYLNNEWFFALTGLLLIANRGNKHEGNTNLRLFL